MRACSNPCPAYRRSDLEKIRGLADIRNGIIIDGPSVTVIPDQAKLAQFHITPADFRTQLSAYNEGVVVGQVQEGEQMLNIRLRFTNFRENSVDKIRNQPVFAPDGTFRPLSDFADIRISKGDPEITREDLKSNIVVTARLENRDIGSTIKEIKSALAANLVLPAGYYITYGGAYAQQQASFRELLLILISAIILVFTVLLFTFRDLRFAILIIFISILGIGGCIWALYITGIQLNVGSYTGIIMIVGIIAENAVFTVNYIARSNSQGRSRSQHKSEQNQYMMDGGYICRGHF